MRLNTSIALYLLAIVTFVAVQTTSKTYALQLVNEYKRLSQLDGETTNLSRNECRSPSIEEFPDDFLSLDQKRKGGVLIHILIVAYLFCAITIVCDEYFIQSMHRICEG